MAEWVRGPKGAYCLYHFLPSTRNTAGDHHVILFLAHCVPWRAGCRQDCSASTRSVSRRQVSPRDPSDKGPVVTGSDQRRRGLGFGSKAGTATRGWGAADSHWDIWAAQSWQHITEVGSTTPWLSARTENLAQAKVMRGDTRLQHDKHEPSLGFPEEIV